MRSQSGIFSTPVLKILPWHYYFSGLFCFRSLAHSLSWYLWRAYMKSRFLLSASLVLATLSASGVAIAQRYSIIGLWGTSRPTGVTGFYRFAPDGRCLSHILVPGREHVAASEIYISCQYRLSADENNLYIRNYDWRPKFGPIEGLHLRQWTSRPIYWQGPDSFTMLESTGPQQYVRHH